MSCRILVVEDEIFVAAEIEHVVTEMGHTAVGVVANKQSALALGPETDIALVDLNLEDGPTGIAVGRILAQIHGVTVLFMTANPSQLGKGVSGTLGVLAKPVGGKELKQAVEYAVAQHEKKKATPPRRLQLFNWGGGGALLA
ncbi:response regulator [Devosia rhodophyticola]|uniref:Response regulator n=1 Tax=Devosia rhodophyticola TaxID=3026423 RepID=A0ABY7YY83_9HYPH|nr:response regulator [Devosia rhodophyticola]WDR06350.1 response regulator [Devosia rhodophyticola]